MVRYRLRIPAQIPVTAYFLPQPLEAGFDLLSDSINTRFRANDISRQSSKLEVMEAVNEPHNPTASKNSFRQKGLTVAFPEWFLKNEIGGEVEYRVE
jgi:hypothetical protein